MVAFTSSVTPVSSFHISRRSVSLSRKRRTSWVTTRATSLRVLSAWAMRKASASLGSFMSPTRLRMPSSVMKSAPTPVSTARRTMSGTNPLVSSGGSSSLTLPLPVVDSSVPFAELHQRLVTPRDRLQIRDRDAIGHVLRDAHQRLRLRQLRVVGDDRPSLVASAADREVDRHPAQEGHRELLRRR